MRKYYWVFKSEIQNILEYRFNFLSSFLFSLVPLGVNVLLWITVSKNNSSFEMNIGEIISYYLIILVSSNLTEPSIVSQISKDIRLGDLNKYLVKPCNYSLYYLAKDIPSKLMFIAMNAFPIIVLFVLMNHHLVLTISFYRIAIYCIFIVFGYLINFLIDLLIAWRA